MKSRRSWEDHRLEESGGDVFNLIGDVDPTDEDGDIGIGDSTGVLASLGGEIFSGGKKLARKTLLDGKSSYSLGFTFDSIEQTEATEEQQLSYKEGNPDPDTCIAWPMPTTTETCTELE
ncbi:hypothetical protein Tco_0365690 [Tanacetum coccineum]